MSGFLLSPGITPELTDVFVLELPIVLGAAYLLGGRRGFELAFAANAIVLAIVKLVTDYSDPWDDAVALSALFGGGLWIRVREGGGVSGVAARTVLGLIGIVSFLFGLVKLTDFYDPFDLLLADAAIVCGIALLVLPRGPASGPKAPRELPETVRA